MPTVSIGSGQHPHVGRFFLRGGDAGTLRPVSRRKFVGWLRKAPRATGAGRRSAFRNGAGQKATDKISTSATSPCIPGPRTSKPEFRRLREEA